jgi:hypothetical protein
MEKGGSGIFCGRTSTSERIGVERELPFAGSPKGGWFRGSQHRFLSPWTAEFVGPSMVV